MFTPKIEIFGVTLMQKETDVKIFFILNALTGEHKLFILLEKKRKRSTKESLTTMIKSIRIKLLILIFLAILPTLGIIIYSNYERQRQDLDAARADARILLQGIANEHENVVAVTRKFLATLARLPVVKNKDAAACEKLFQDLLNENAQYITIFAADESGMIFANALTAGKYSIKQRKYFQDLLRTKDFSAGEYIIGPVTGRSGLPFAFPVLDSSGRVIGVVGASFDLDKYAATFPGMTKFPQDSTLNILDRDFMRLYRYPDDNKYKGKKDLPEIIRNLWDFPQEGTFNAVGVDGIRRLYAYQSFSLRNDSPPYLYMRVGIPEAQILARTQKTFLRHAGLLSFSLLTALLIAWFFGNALIVKKLYKLVNVSRQLGQGDLSVRTGLDRQEDELGKLAGSFDDMAQALETKELERRQAEDKLRQNQKFLDTLLNSIPSPVFYKDDSGRYIGFNKAFEKFFGASREKLIGKTVFDINPPKLAKIYYEKDQELLTGGVSQQYEAQVVNALGQTRDVIFEKAVFTDGQGNIKGVIGVILDITERQQMEEEREKLISELQEALAEVKTLTGLLPICASCKKIRNDQGYWEKMEKYIGDRSPVKFSHGICPECTKKLYPELIKENK